MSCREGKLSGGAFFIALDINHWFGDPILILVDIPIGKPDESPHLPDKDRQPFAGALSRDEIQSLEELDSERLSANWHLSSS